MTLDQLPREVSAASEPVLVARSLSKAYGHVQALQEVDLSLRRGTITAIVGDNGAGKSTLVSLLSGLAKPDRGVIEINGESVALEGTRHATGLGITTVFQHLALVDQRNVADNLHLGYEPVRFRYFLDRKQMRAEARQVIDRLRVDIPDMNSPVGKLSGGQRQAVAVSRAVLRGSQIFLMDEPTAALGLREAERVSNLIAQLRAQGGAILLVSHNIESVFSLADRIAVFRLGRKVIDVAADETSREEIVSFIVGAREQRA